MDYGMFPVIAMEEWRVEFQYDADTWGTWTSHTSEALAWEHLDRCQANTPDIQLRVMHIQVKTEVLSR